MPWFRRRYRGRPESALRLLRQLLIPQFLILAVILVVGSATVGGFALLNGHQESARESVLLLETARADVIAAQAGLRGYALVASPELLRSYVEASDRVDADLAHLARRLDGHEHTEAVQLRASFAGWRTEYAEPVRDAVAAGRIDEVRNAFASGEGRRRVDSLMAAADGLGEDIRSDVAVRGRQTKAFGWGAVLLATGLAGAGTVASLRIMRRLRLEVQVPLLDLAVAATRLSHRDFTARADGGQLMELFTLASTFNRMATELERTVAELQELDQMKSQFISSVSHELRTPLTSIRGYLEALLENEAGELNDEQREFAEIAYRNAGRLETLIGDLLLLARLESGRVALNREPVNVGALLTDLVKDLAPQVRGKPLTLSVSIADGMWVEGDPVRLQQVFANLVSNAIKFTPAGRGFAIRCDQHHSRIVVDVSDEGVGIPAEELSRVTERFFRASSAGDTEGTGLGLLITKQLIELHGGQLSIASEEGSGSTFTVALPAGPSPADGTDNIAR